MDYSRKAIEMSNELVHYHCCSPGDLWVKPGDVVGIHVDTSMAAVAVIYRGATGVIMREVVSGTEIRPPPCIMEEVAARVVFQSILNGGGRIPECGSLWLGRFEFGWPLTQYNTPKSWRGRV